MTKPLQDVLPLQIEPAVEKKLLKAHAALREMIAVGTKVYMMWLELGKHNPEYKSPESIVVPLYIRHLLELYDSVAEQIRLCIIVPTNLQLRAILEAHITLEYLLEKDTKLRSAAVLYLDLIDQINSYRNYIPEEKRYSDYKRRIENSKLINKVIVSADIAKKVTEQKLKAMDEPHFDEVRRIFKSKNLKIERITNGYKCYQLLSDYGIGELSDHFHRYDLYAHLYSEWSDTMHGSKLYKDVVEQNLDKELTDFKQIRNFERANLNITIALNLSFSMMLLLAESSKKIGNNYIWKYIDNWISTYRSNYL